MLLSVAGENSGRTGRRVLLLAFGPPSVVKRITSDAYLAWDVGGVGKAQRARQFSIPRGRLAAFAALLREMIGHVLGNRQMMGRLGNKTILECRRDVVLSCVTVDDVGVSRDSRTASPC